MSITTDFDGDGLPEESYLVAGFFWGWLVVLVWNLYTGRFVNAVGALMFLVVHAWWFERFYGDVL